MKKGTLAIGLGVTLAGLAVAGAAMWHTAEPHLSEAEAPGGSDAPIEHIVVGGGSTPESNEFSIEQDLALASKVFDGPGLTLYAAGADTSAVRVTNADDREPSLRSRLGRIFNPRVGRSSTYRPTTLTVDDPASPEAFYGALAEAGRTGGGPLDVYVAGHGDRGETPAQNAVVWWGNRVVTPADLATALAEASPKRPVRFVMTTCFSGGFAEIAFDRADPESGATDLPVCGLFASTWDREAGGCDPDPDRGLHEGYGVHFLGALDEQSTDGAAIRLDERDFDGDGATGFLDAHTWARLNSESIDVPTTTSERFLRFAVDPATAPAGRAGVVPHEDAVIERLSTRLDVPSEDEALRRARALDAAIEEKIQAETEAAAQETEAYWRVAAEMLARWPVLDDPWHPRWKATIDEHGEAIRRFLEGSDEVAALDRAMATTNRASAARADLEAERAPYDRLLRAYETRRLATALEAADDANWRRFQRFRACEQGR